MKTQELQLSEMQVEALKRIARENKTEPEELLHLAVRALIREALKEEGWLEKFRQKLQEV